jgi:hypothetical protein
MAYGDRFDPTNPPWWNAPLPERLRWQMQMSLYMASYPTGQHAVLMSDTPADEPEPFITPPDEDGAEE